MLKLPHICLTNALILSATYLLSRNGCYGFQIRTIRRQPTNTFVKWKTTSVDAHRIRPTSQIKLYTNSIRFETFLYTIKSESLMVNGSKGKSSMSFFEGMDVSALPEGGELTMTVEVESPPMSFDKYITMQEKRAVVTIRYSGDAGLKPYFLTIAKKLKQSHPDIVIERRILPSVIDSNYEATFEVLVEGKVVIGKSRQRKVSRNGNNDVHDIIGRRSVYVSMNELDLAITRARRKHRPTTVYGGGGTVVDTDAHTMNGKQRNSKVSPTINSNNNNNTEKKNSDSSSGRMDWSD